MKMRQLLFFITVADERGFNRAANRLHVAQPSLSVQIKALEEEVGARLFERDKRRVVLTQAGRRFLQHARTILSIAETAKIETRCAEAGELGTIDVGYTTSAMFSSVLPHVLRQFRHGHAHVVLTLHELTSLGQLHGLLDRTLDVGVLRKPDTDTPAGIQISEWYRTPLVVALPQDHPLARRQSVLLSDLKSESLITYPHEAGTAIYWQVMDLCTRAGFRPRVAREVLESATIIGLVAAGVGIAIVPADTSCIRYPGIAYKSIADPGAYSILYLARRENDHSEYVQTLFRMLSERSARPLAFDSTERPRRKPGRTSSQASLR